MKIQIDKYGQLSLERAGKMKGQVCPFASAESWCGDWCPHFGEPDKSGSLVIIHLCQNKLMRCDKPDFTDERTANTQES